MAEILQYYQKRRGPVLCGGMVLLFGVLFIYLLAPLGKNALAAAGETYRQYGDIQSALSTADLSDSLKSLEAASKKSEALLKAVPRDGRSSYILNQLLNGAAAFDLSLSDIQSLEEISHGHYVEIPFALKTQGSWAQLQQYLIHLENMELTVKLRNMIIESEKINQPVIHTELELSAFVQKSE